MVSANAILAERAHSASLGTVMASTIYLDHNATTPVAPEVLGAVTRALAEDFGNASSIHALGRRAKAVLDEARTDTAALVGGDPADLVFTSGGTESDNLALRGLADALDGSPRRRVLVSAVEHEAVINTAKALARKGFVATQLPVDRDGLLSP